ncbi:MAG TPA: hypothetical protein VLB83_03120 [Candidatus Paceibacterota bacterium]|nr:hypothetical protein [Candidatus Paceibacterota bacterium]
MGKQRANRRPRETRQHIDADRKTPPPKRPDPASLRTAHKDTLVATSAEIKARAQAAWERGNEEEALRFEQMYRDQLLIEATETSQDAGHLRRQALLRDAEAESWYNGGVKIDDDLRPFFQAKRARIPQ